MKFNSLLKKAQSRIVNPTSMDRAKTANAMDIERFAVVTLHNKRAADALSMAGMAGLGGLVAGGGTYASLKKRDDETEKEFKKRKIKEVIVNAGAGAIAGGALPVASDMLSSLLKEQKTPVVDKAIQNLAIPSAGAATMAAVDQVRHNAKLPELEKREVAARKALADAQKTLRPTTVTGLDASGNPVTTTTGPTNAEIAAGAKAEASANKAISSSTRGLERSHLVTDNMLDAFRGLSIKDPRKSGMSLLKALGNSVARGKLRNPLAAATVLTTLPFLLKKFDQSYSS